MSGKCRARSVIFVSTVVFSKVQSRRAVPSEGGGRRARGSSGAAVASVSVSVSVVLESWWVSWVLGACWVLSGGTAVVSVGISSNFAFEIDIGLNCFVFGFEIEFALELGSKVGCASRGGCKGEGAWRLGMVDHLMGGGGVAVGGSGASL